MILSIVFFALNTLAIRGLVGWFPGITGWHASLFRGIAGVLVIVIFYSTGRGFRLSSLIKKPLVIWRGIIGGFGIGLFYITVIELGPGRASFIALTYPIFATIIAYFFLKEHLSARRLFWITISFAGLGIFFLEKGLAQETSIYDALALFGALLAAVVVVLIRKLHATGHGSTIYGAQAFYGILFAIPISGGSTLELAPIAAALLFLAGLLAAGGQLTMTFAYRHLDVSTGSSLHMSLPVVTAIGSCLLFGEQYGALEIIGATITIVANWKLNRKASKSSPNLPTIHPKNS
jgi:drug/metabolite transporter (DMT)-like permease